jgi:hypothetical protein
VFHISNGDFALDESCALGVGYILDGVCILDAVGIV